jgi:hypothetical protein
MKLARRWQVLAVTAVAVFMGFLDVRIVNVAFPDIERDFAEASRTDPGAGVGFSFASWGSAAVAQLPATRFATGSAVLACVRQIGAVLGIAALVAVLEAAPVTDPLSGFVDAWTMMAVTGGVVAVLAIGLGHVRALVPATA